MNENSVPGASVCSCGCGLSLMLHLQVDVAETLVDAVALPHLDLQQVVDQVNG